MADVDLRLIDAVWGVQDRDVAGLRPTDRHTVRQGAAAAARLGERLIGGEAPMICRVLPEITETTRLREAPDRFWLEFVQRDADVSRGRAPVLFVELMPEAANIGLFHPGFASDTERKDIWNRFRKHKPKVFRGLKKGRAGQVRIDETDISPGSWSMSTCSPPGFASEVSDVADGQEALAGEPTGSAETVSISLSLNAEDLTVGKLTLCLAKAVEVFAPFFADQVGGMRPGRAAKGNLTLVASPQSQTVAHQAGKRTF